MNRQDACSTRKFTLCGTGILPVLEKGARCEIRSIEGRFTLGRVLNHFFSVPLCSYFGCVVTVLTADSDRARVFNADLI